MNRFFARSLALLVVAVSMIGCSHMRGDAGWTTLV